MYIQIKILLMEKYHRESKNAYDKYMGYYP